MLKELVKIANELDKKGLVKEADYLDSIIKLSRDYEAEIAEAYSQRQALSSKRRQGRRRKQQIDELTERIATLEAAQAAAAAATETAETATTEAEESMAATTRPPEEGEDPAGVVQPTDTMQRTSPGQAATGQSTGSAGEIQDGGGYEYNVINKERLGPAPRDVGFKITKTPPGKSGLGYVITVQNNSAAHSKLVEIATEKLLGGDDGTAGRVINEFRNPDNGFNANAQLQSVWSDIQERLGDAWEDQETDWVYNFKHLGNALATSRPGEAEFRQLAVNLRFAPREVDGLVAAAKFAFGS